MEDTLSVGDSICLYSEESYGFVFATQSSDVHNEVAVGRGQDRLRPDIANQHVVSFEIGVANKYKFDKKYRKLKSKADDHPNDYSLVNAVAQAKIAADAERDDNLQEQRRQSGKKVTYGQIIQLRHSYTRKFLHVSSTKTSHTESNNMAVELLEYNAKHAQFRIMPRYKVKAEGDVVQIADQIVLESVKSSGQYLHVSKGTLPQQSVYCKSLELNLSVRQSGITVYRRYKPKPNDDTKVKVGDLIRFYHKEMEAYLVAEGLFDDEVTEDVHLRLRPVDQANPKTLFPSSSALTYWQIELQEGPITGGVLKWEQQCKIVHMCTQRYLMVDEKKNVTLTAEHNDPKTVFRLHPVIKESDDIPFESYCRMEHVMTGCWLHALTDEYVKKNDAKSAETAGMSMTALKWTTAILKRVSAIQEMQYDDAFTIQTVTEDLTSIFNYMCGMVPFIQKLVADKREGLILNAKMSHTVITALKEMKEFMIENSVPSKKRQKLLRNLRVIELLVSLLTIPYRGSSDQSHLTKIFVEAYDVLYTYLMGDSRKNELYIAKHIDFFLTQFEYKETELIVSTGYNASDPGKIGLNAAHMVMELIRDNRKIVDRITTKHIDKFVELLRRERNYRYLDLLGVLCVCDKVSIADNQKYITQAWLMKDNKNCVFLTDLGQKIKKTNGIVYVSMTNGRKWMELHDFAAVSVEDEDYLFLEHQLELFRMLCHGQNNFCINVITQELNYLTWEEAFTCLSDSRLPDRLRAKYCDLIITLFVDIAENVSVIDRVNLSYIYEDIDQYENESEGRDFTANNQDKLDKSNTPTYAYFPALRDWISKFLATNGDMTASLIGNNMLVEQVLRLVYNLVQYGFYHRSEDIKMLLEPLMSLLDGRNDKPYPNVKGHDGEKVLAHFRQVGRFERSPETKAIVDAKCQALEVLNLFFNFIFNLRMEKFMHLFKETHYAATTPGAAIPELGSLLNETYDIEESESTNKNAMRKLKQIFEETSFFRNYDVKDILLDLAHYDYDDIIRKSMHLLNRYYSSYSNLFNRAVQAQVLITQKSVKAAQDLWSFLPTLRRLSSSKLTNEQTVELAEILQRLIHMCELEGESEEPHSMNQTIVYNNGVLEDAFTIISQEIDIKLLDQYAGLRKIFQKTFLLLKNLSKGNKIIQQRLFDRIDMILLKEGAMQEMAEALTEVFTGNSTTCMKITGQQVQKIMALVARYNIKVPQLLDLLNAVVKVEELDLPLKRNQNYVMNYFMQYRSDIASIIDLPEKERTEILESDSASELNYLIALVDLLATCAEGENRFIESICQTIFNIPGLLRVLNNQKVNDNLKRPFLRFFLWVYLNTAGGMIESGAGDLPHDKELWRYLTSLNEVLLKTTDYARVNPQEAKQLLKRPPAKSESRHSRYFGYSKPPAPQVIIHDDSDSDTDTVKSLVPSDRGVDPDEAVRGSLHYLFDAVMPFLQIFCRSYYQPDPSLYPDEADQLDTLAKSFIHFMEAFAPLISLEKQLKSLVNCMTTILSTSTLPVKVMEEFHEKYGGGLNSSDIRSDARKKYEAYFETEEDINDKLNIFANNMLVMYGGKNDVQTQINFPSKKLYTEIGGDEDLPLGQEFQDHIKCFINPKGNTPQTTYALAEKLVKQLEISERLTHLSETEKLEQEVLDVKCLQLLRGLIHNEIVKLPDDWDMMVDKVGNQLSRIQDVQDALDSFEVLVGVLGHLNRPQEDIIRELLAFCVALMFNGNAQVQDSLIAFFTGTREETFFFAIKNRMNLSAVATRERRLLHAQHQAKIEEIVEQARTLQKAMANSKMATTEIMMANKIGSMLSMAKKSSANLRNPMGSRRMGSRNLRGSRPRLNVSRQNVSKGNGTLAIPQSSKKSSTIELQKMGNKSKVAPMDTADEDVDIGKIDDEELQELVSQAMAGDLDFKDDGYIELQLRLLGLMCDNQHRGLQDYLREQPDNIKSVNLVAETTKFLSILYSSVNDKTISLVTQLFDTLVEFTSGNFQNQAVVFDHKICDFINHILRLGQFKGCKLNDVYTLKKAIVTLVKALTEENPPESEDGDSGNQNFAKGSTGYCLSLIDKQYSSASDRLGGEYRELRDKKLEQIMLELDGQYIARHYPPSCLEVMEFLDTDTLMATMTAAYNDIQVLTTQVAAEKVKNPELEELRDLVTEVGFAYFHTVCRKLDLQEELKKEDIVKPKYQAAWNYFTDSTLSIEVVKNDVLQKIYFRVTDKNILREEIKEKFKYEVDRSSPSNKLREFMDWSEDIIEDIKYQRKVHSFPVSRILVQLWTPLNVSVLLLSVLICVLMMAFFIKPDADPVPNYLVTGGRWIILGFGVVHNILSLGILLSYFISNKPSLPVADDFAGLLSLFKPKSGAEKKKKKVSHLEVKLLSGQTAYYIVVTLHWNEHSTLIPLIGHNLCFGSKKWKDLKTEWRFPYIVLCGFGCLIFFALSICGTVFYGYFFAFHMLHITVMNQLLKRVLQAVTKNGLSLLMVALLGLIIFYIFALFAYAFFRPDIPAGNYCDTLYQCLVTVIHHGLPESLYNILNDQTANKSSFTNTLPIVFYDVAFFLLVTTIGLNIIFGIIVDTFSELRDSKWNIDNDMRTNCFICSRESYDFERHGTGFEKHVKAEHNQWAYLFFFIHLNETRHNDYSSLELHVSDLAEATSIDFFPLNRALSLQHEEDTNEKRMEMLMQQVEYLVHKIKQDEAEKERQKEKQRQMEWERQHKKKPK